MTTHIQPDEFSSNFRFSIILLRLQAADIGTYTFNIQAKSIDNPNVIITSVQAPNIIVDRQSLRTKEDTNLNLTMYSAPNTAGYFTQDSSNPLAGPEYINAFYKNQILMPINYRLVSSNPIFILEDGEALTNGYSVH
jgi:hypothetical protein